MDKRSLHRFSLRGEMLPSYIPTRIAEKIVFAGESMQMFEAEKQTMSKRKGQAFCWNVFDILQLIFIKSSSRDCHCWKTIWKLRNISWNIFMNKVGLVESRFF